MKRIMVFALFAALLVLGSGMEAWAADPAPLPHPPGSCTNDPQFELGSIVTPGEGLISTIVSDIKNVLDGTRRQLFSAIMSNPSFNFVVQVTLSLYIAIYGIFFTFGMVQITLQDFFGRMVKIGLIYWLFVDWPFIADFLIHFFNDSTDSIITEATRIAVGGVDAGLYDPSKPFAILDDVIAKTVSAKMAVTLLATLFTGIYGLFFGILLFWALKSLLLALFTAIWVYLMSLVLKTLLIGLAPIFIVFILFSRTKTLFDGWLNQLVNASLQPIFLFIFFAFFVRLISASIDNILATPVCWTEWVDSVRGTPLAIHYWRFAVQENGVWEPYGGVWDFDGSTTGGRPFPIDIMHILIFLMLVELASKFNSVVLMIASDIASASANLASMQGPFSEWFSPAKGTNANLPGGIGGRMVPGGYTGPDYQRANREVNETQSRGGVDAIRDLAGSRKGPPSEQ